MVMRGTLGRVGEPHARPDHRGPIDRWPAAGYDAVLHMLDRQVIDSAGMLVGKVDDLEIVEDADGALVPTAILMGPPAFLPRFGDRMGNWLTERYVQASVAHADRARPGVIEFDLIDEVSSAVHLSRPREGLVHRRPDAEHPGARAASLPARRSLGALLRLRVQLPTGTPGPGTLRVLDARIARDERTSGQRVAALVVGRGRPGSLLGYERSSARGPALVAGVVRRLHRHSRLVELGPDVDVDWTAGIVTVGAGARIAGLDA